MTRADYATMPVRTLESLFGVTGHFYIGNGKFPCRKLLNIRTREESVPDLPDLMVVMMNPGNSAPLCGGDDGRSEVPAIPDNTQHQIMRVMLATGFRYARILNLSDYRNRRSGAFVGMLSTLDREFPQHTIFHPDRAVEFRELFNPSAPVVLGWGCHDRLKGLARNALERLDRRRIIGIRHRDKPWAYYHPMRHRGWHDKIIDRLVRKMRLSRRSTAAATE